MAPARPCGTTSKRSRSSGFGVLLIVDDFAQLGRADGPEIWLNCGWLNATRPARGSAPARRLRSRPSSSDGYEDVNDAERLRHDPAMRWIVGGKAAQGCAASPSQMGRFHRLVQQRGQILNHAIGGALPVPTSPQPPPNPFPGHTYTSGSMHTSSGDTEF